MSGSKPNPIPGGDKQRKIRRRSMVHSPPHQSNRSTPSSFLWSSSSTPVPLLPEQGFPSRPFPSSPISSSVKRRRRKRRREKERSFVAFFSFLGVFCPSVAPAYLPWIGSCPIGASWSLGRVVLEIWLLSSCCDGSFGLLQDLCWRIFFLLVGVLW